MRSTITKLAIFSVEKYPFISSFYLMHNSLTRSYTHLSAIEAEAKAEHDPAIHEIFTILPKTDDKISDVGIETLANWKLGRLSV